MKLGTAIAGMLGCWLMIILGVIVVCGLIGMVTWPYTVNTWGEYFNLDEGEEWNPIDAWPGGFLMGICPVVGQLSIGAANWSPASAT